MVGKSKYRLNKDISEMIAEEVRINYPQRTETVPKRKAFGAIYKSKGTLKHRAVRKEVAFTIQRVLHTNKVLEEVDLNRKGTITLARVQMRNVKKISAMSHF